LKNALVATLVAAVLVGANGLILLDAAQNQMDELNEQFNEIMSETLGFLDHAWDVAKKFQDPNYDYDPSELGNYTKAEIPQLVSAKKFGKVRLAGAKLRLDTPVKAVFSPSQASPRKIEVLVGVEGSFVEDFVRLCRDTSFHRLI